MVSVDNVAVDSLKMLYYIYCHQLYMIRILKNEIKLWNWNRLNYEVVLLLLLLLRPLFFPAFFRTPLDSVFVCTGKSKTKRVMNRLFYVLVRPISCIQFLVTFLLLLRLTLPCLLIEGAMLLLSETVDEGRCLARVAIPISLGG